MGWSVGLQKKMHFKVSLFTVNKYGFCTPILKNVHVIVGRTHGIFHAFFL